MTWIDLTTPTQPQPPSRPLRPGVTHYARVALVVSGGAWMAGISLIILLHPLITRAGLSPLQAAVALTGLCGILTGWLTFHWTQKGLIQRPWNNEDVALFGIPETNTDPHPPRS